jgi:CcmD family protein
MKRFRLFFTLCLGLFVSLQAQAQEVQMAESWRQDGKIYIVIGVFSIILTGLFVYVFSLDRKIGKLEDQNK